MRLGALCLSAALALLAQPAAADPGKCTVTVLAKLPVVMEGSRASVPVSINGQETRVWLDSGAFFNFMPKARAVELGLTTSPLPSGLYVRGIGGTFVPELTRVKNFGLVGATLHDMEFIVGGSDSGNGFLGANLLGVWDTEFDLAKGSVKIIKESGCAKLNLAYWASGMSVSEAPLLKGDEPSDHHIYVEVLINQHSVRAVLDTGAPTSIISRRTAELAGIDMSAPAVVASEKVGGLGNRERQSWIARTQLIAIGGEEIRNSPIRVIDDAASDMLLGVDFLMAHHVLVSQPQRKVYITYNGGPIFSSSTDQETGLKSTTRGVGMGEAEQTQEPSTADEFAGRGSARLHSGDAAGAIADFTSAIKLAPGRADLLAHRARAHVREGHPELAEKDVDAALKITPKDHELLGWRARFKLRRNDRAGAIAALDAAVAATPPGSLNMAELVALYEHLGMADRGLALLDPVIELHRNDSRFPKLLNARSWNRALANADLDRALKDIDLAIRKAGPNPAMLDTRALVHLRRKELAAAIADETAALDQTPNLAAALFTRGLARLAAGDSPGGSADIASARAIQPTIDGTYASYGLAAPGAKPAAGPAALPDEEEGD